MSGYALVVRPQPRADKMCKALRERGINAVPLPVTRIIYRPNNEHTTDEPDGYITTSMYGVNALNNVVQHNNLQRTLPLYAVGKATAEHASGCGFTGVISAAGNAASLVDRIITHFRSPGKLLYVGAKKLSVDLPDILRKHGIQTEYRVGYEAHPIKTMKKHYIDLLQSGQVTCVYIFSADNCSNFVKLLQNYHLLPLNSHIQFYCPSPAIAEKLHKSALFANNKINILQQ